MAMSATSGDELKQPPRPQGRRTRRKDELAADSSEGQSGRCPEPLAVPRFDVAGLIRRARREARLSQREMASMIGVSQSTIARAETGDAVVTVPVLLAALAVGGIDLIACGADGEVLTMRSDALRDRGGRSLPAHLHCRVASEFEDLPSHWRGSVARTAPVRWARRGKGCDPEFLPLQHPGPEDLVSARDRDVSERAFRAMRNSPPAPEPRPAPSPPWR